ACFSLKGDSACNSAGLGNSWKALTRRLEVDAGAFSDTGCDMRLNFLLCFCVAGVVPVCLRGSSCCAATCQPRGKQKAAPHLRAARLRGESALAFVSVLRFYCALARHQQDAGRTRSLVIIKSVNEHEENSNTLSFFSRYFALRAGDLSGAKLASTSECGPSAFRTWTFCGSRTDRRLSSPDPMLLDRKDRCRVPRRRGYACESASSGDGRTIPPSAPQW